MKIAFGCADETVLSANSEKNFQRLPSVVTGEDEKLSASISVKSLLTYRCESWNTIGNDGRTNESGTKERQLEVIQMWFDKGRFRISRKQRARNVFLVYYVEERP